MKIKNINMKFSLKGLIANGNKLEDGSIDFSIEEIEMSVQEFTESLKSNKDVIMAMMKKGDDVGYVDYLKESNDKEIKDDVERKKEETFDERYKRLNEEMAEEYKEIEAMRAKFERTKAKWFEKQRKEAGEED